MQSVRPLLLLLLLLAPALAVAKSGSTRCVQQGDGHGKGRTKDVEAKDLRQQSSTNEFVFNFRVDVSAITYKAMEYAKQCTPLGEYTVQFLLSRTKLVFFYGDSISDLYEVYLKDSPKLVDHVRWKKDLPMAVYTFGWLSTPINEHSHQIVKAYHRNGGFNLVLVAWHESGTFLEYGAAVTMVPRVGRAVAQALAQLPPSVTIGHLVGHSLGAQVTGHIARNLPSRPRFIVGLDPAGPLFYPAMFGCQDPISSTDADHVTVLHTDWSRLSANEWTGSVDFMPHDGHRPQPGCNNINNLDIDTSSAFGYAFACSHNRAIMLFANAISNSSSIVGTQCYSYDAFTNKLCQNNPKAYLTQPSENQGVFYFTTKDSEPYGRGVEGA